MENGVQSYQFVDVRESIFSRKRITFEDFLSEIPDVPEIKGKPGHYEIHPTSHLGRGRHYHEVSKGKMGDAIRELNEMGCYSFQIQITCLGDLAGSWSWQPIVHASRKFTRPLEKAV